MQIKQAPKLPVRPNVIIELTADEACDLCAFFGSLTRSSIEETLGLVEGESIETTDLTDRVNGLAGHAYEALADLGYERA